MKHSPDPQLLRTSVGLLLCPSANSAKCLLMRGIKGLQLLSYFVLFVFYDRKKMVVAEIKNTWPVDEVVKLNNFVKRLSEGFI